MSPALATPAATMTKLQNDHFSSSWAPEIVHLAPSHLRTIALSAEMVLELLECPKLRPPSAQTAARRETWHAVDAGFSAR